MNMKIIWTLVLMLPIISCSSADVQIEGQNRSLAEIKNAILTTIGRPRVISENQREITSKYYGRNSDTDFDPNRSKERLYTKYIILGERRPYDLTVQVLVEQKIDGQYELIGEDEKLSLKAAKELSQKLNQSRDNRNVIDDFRPF